MTSISKVYEAAGISHATLYRYLEPDGTPMKRVNWILLALPTGRSSGRFGYILRVVVRRRRYA